MKPLSSDCSMFDPFTDLVFTPIPGTIRHEINKDDQRYNPFLRDFQDYIRNEATENAEKRHENREDGVIGRGGAGDEEGNEEKHSKDGVLTRPTPSVVKSRSIPHRQREMLDTLCLCVGQLNQLLMYRLSVGLDMRLYIRSDLDTDVMLLTAGALLAKLANVYKQIHRRSVTDEVSSVMRLFKAAQRGGPLETEVVMEEAAKRVTLGLVDAVLPRKHLKRGASNVGVYLSNALRMSEHVTCHAISETGTTPDKMIGSGCNPQRCRMGKPFSKQEVSILLADVQPAIDAASTGPGSDGVIDWDTQGASHISMDRFRHLLPPNAQTVIVGGASWQRNRARVCKKSVELYLPCFALLASVSDTKLRPQRLLALRLLSVMIAAVLMLSHSFVPNRQYRLERMLEPLLQAAACIYPNQTASGGKPMSTSSVR
jgi:hypothetical protein